MCCSPWGRKELGMTEQLTLITLTCQEAKKKKKKFPAFMNREGLEVQVSAAWAYED